MTHGRVTAPQMEDKGFADVGDDSTLCLLEVSQLRTKAVDGRGALQTKQEGWLPPTKRSSAAKIN